MNQPEKCALIVIDVQDSFLKRYDCNTAEFASYQTKQLALIEHAKNKGIATIGILHESFTTPEFMADSGLVKPMDWLPTLDVFFTKHVRNAFTDTGLKLWLDQREIRHLIISGIQTEQCCETTTRVGSDLGYHIDFITEATMTFPMKHAATQREYSVQEIRQHTELVLENRFARVLSVAQWANG